MHRGGAVFAQGTVGLSIDHCSFEALGGNGLFFSNFNRNAQVTDCEFAYIGDSAVVQAGSTKFARTQDKSGTDLMDGTDGDQPSGTIVDRCVMREVGLYGKQTSAFTSFLSWNTTIRGSLIFNGPRAGINW